MAAAAFVLPAAASAAGSPSAVLASILAAARAERSVHYESSESSGTSSVRQTGDAGSSVGIQRITYSSGGRTGHVTVIATTTRAFVRGDAFTLAGYMGLKPSAAARYGGVWIRWTAADSGFASVAAGVRLGSTIDELTPSGSLATVPPTTVGGRRVIGVAGTATSGGASVTTTLYASATGAPLPVRETAIHGSDRLTVRFSGWNEQVHAALPARSVAVSVVQKTP